MNSWIENNYFDIFCCLFGISDFNGINWGYMDCWLENGLFLCLKILELGYMLFKVWVFKVGLQNVCVYMVMENFFIIIDYKGYIFDLGMVDVDGVGILGGLGVMICGCDDGCYLMVCIIIFGL